MYQARRIVINANEIIRKRKKDKKKKKEGKDKKKKKEGKDKLVESTQKYF
jgi:hypothetical protein